MNSQILTTAMAKQKAPDARLERNAADGLFAKPLFIRQVREVICSHTDQGKYFSAVKGRIKRFFYSKGLMEEVFCRLARHVDG